jgi:hypothetical protein
VATDTGNISMNRTRRWAVASVVLSATACIDTGQAPATVSLTAQGTRATEPIQGKDNWTIQLGRADVAFGPLYVCAGTQAGKYCDAARLEWLESVVIDALDDDAQEVGELTGTTGPVRSWMCDLGITSLLTQPNPIVLDAAKKLGGNSVILEGVAEKPPHVITFALELPIQVGDGAELGVSVLASFPKEPFAHEVRGEGDELSVQFDPHPWMQAIDFEGLVEGQDCEADGCNLNVTLDQDSPAGVAVRTAILAGKRPLFSWSSAP